MLMAVDIKGRFEQILGQADMTAKLPDSVSEWCMVLVRSGMEQDARDSMRRRGVGAWWPNFQKEIGAKDRESGKRFRKLITVGVLPGVLISPARFSQLFWDVLDLAPGVINVLRRPDKSIALLTDCDIATIHTIERGLNEAPLARVGHSFEVGDTVRLLADEFKRLPPAPIVRCLQSGHMEVEVNMFGGLVRMEVLPAQIELVDSVTKNHSSFRSTDARDRPGKSPSRRKA